MQDVVRTESNEEFVLMNELPLERKNEQSSVELAVLLATAITNVQIGCEMTKCRALCDSGSHLNLITKNCAKRIGARPVPCNQLVRGIGNMAGVRLNKKVILSIYPWFNEQITFTIDFLIIAELPMQVPYREICGINVPSHITLADPNFRIPGNIDLLLGADVWSRIIGSKIYTLEHGAIIQETKFGFIVLGRCEIAESNFAALSSFHVTEQMEQPSTGSLNELEDILKRFWEIEEMQVKRERSKEEQMVEELFVQTHYRNEFGRYVVRIPIKPGCERLANTREIARKRFLWMEQRLQRDPELCEKYVEFMRDYERLGHMQIATSEPENDAMMYHIPHHCILKKFRVVFDTSAKSKLGKSFNQMQMIGEKLQYDLADTIVRFRRNKVAISADIKKMFRQVCIHPEQWDSQRIFWRENPNDPLLEYWLTVVTYGMASSMHSAVRAMMQCAKVYEHMFPQAAQIVLKDFYADDCFSGADDIEEARILCRELDLLLQMGGFQLCQWKSNYKEIVHLMHSADEPIVELSEEPDAKVLGLRWITATDELTFRVIQTEMSVHPTKRAVLSEIGKLYDPNGFLSPIIIVAKIMMQDLWRLKVDWDDQIPNQVLHRWCEFHKSLSQLQNVKIPRWFGTSKKSMVQLHGFADASIKAYGAVLYVRLVDESGNCRCQLMASKSRVAPVKYVSIPRLELAAAELLGRLLRKVIDVCEYGDIRYFLWTDSTVVLHWLRKVPNELKVFVANRVNSIQTRTDVSAWAHVISEQNAADLLSRGMDMRNFIRSELWFNGPKWLMQPQVNWPKSKLDLSSIEYKDFDAECKVMDINCFSLSSTLGANGAGHQSLIFRRSEWGKVMRITAYAFRFIQNSRTKIKSKRIHGRAPKIIEIEQSIMYWVKIAQAEFYSKEIQSLKENKAFPDKSKIADLHPRLVNDVLRVGGRLSQANCAYEQKHPIIIPQRSRLCWLLMNKAHKDTLHGGGQLMMRFIREEFWVPRLRAELRMFVSRCVKCFRMMQKTQEQLMGNLPADRVRECAAFYKTGVDYAGPYNIRARPGRPTRASAEVMEKGYVAVFVCLVTRAVHLEAVTGASSEAFISAFSGFAARRGHCAHLYSDNGTNFTGADVEMQKAIATWSKSETLDFIQSKGTEWHFITPAAPFQGGLWEAAVKTMKHHLRRVMGIQKFSYEVLSTLLAEIEACMNSRPICAMSDDPMDQIALTPGHFLIGGPIRLPIPVQRNEPPKSHLNLWHHMQHSIQDFWKQWSNDYLHTLQQRKKWRAVQKNVQIGQLAIVKAENFPPTHWALGRITKVHTGKDGLVRSVSIMIGRSELDRPVQKLCILPMDDELEYWN